MAKPRNPGRRPKATRRGDVFDAQAADRAWAILTDTERAAVNEHIWFVLQVRSNKERWVVNGLRQIGHRASFAPLIESPRRASRTSRNKDFEARNISRLPGLVFLSVKDGEHGGLNAAIVRSGALKPREQDGEAILNKLRDACGRPLIRGYVADPQGRPVTFARSVVTRMIALSKVPLYGEEEGSPATYQSLKADELLAPGDQCDVVGGLLRGETGRVARVEGHEVVMGLGPGEIRMPARWLRRIDPQDGRAA